LPFVEIIPEVRKKHGMHLFTNMDVPVVGGLILAKRIADLLADDRP
jgi:hypothetical protein